MENILTDYNWQLTPLIILAGFVAGAINTVAGSGSVVTLSMLSFLGLPSTVANGTNRIGVLFQSIVGYTTYKKHTPVENNWGITIATVIGSIIGTQIAVEINEQMMNISIGILMIGLLGLVLMKPKEWLKQKSNEQANWSMPMRYFVFFLVGIYGGFIQAGVGILMLSALILGEGLALAKANGMKLLIVLIYTIPSLLLFVYYGQVNWIYGLLLAIGQIFGAWVSARFATQNPKANVWIRYLLIVILILSIFRFLRLGLL